MISASMAWLSQLKHVETYGSPARDTKEIVASQVKWDMNRPLVIVPERKVNYKFACAEAAYIITGQNRIEFIVNNAMKSFAEYGTDDGVWQAGSYGPPFVDQVPYVVDVMRQDLYTRQAVISIWRPRPYKSKDIPCTLTLQFLVRKDLETGEDALHTVVNMRSSDVWRGLIYDMFCFSIMSAVVAHYVGVRRLGSGYLHAGSSHLYNRDAAAAVNVVQQAFEYIQGPTIEVMDVGDMFDWLMGACSLGDREDCLIALMGGAE